MSEVAGGTIIVSGGAAAGGAAVGTVAAVMLAGTVVLGTGYLVCKGGYQAIKACKEAWEAHLRALEERRRERLQLLRKEDENRIGRLKENLLKMAEEGGIISSELESEVEKKLLQERERILRLQQKKVEVEANWQRIKMLEDELDHLKDRSRSPFEEEPDVNQQNYLNKLEQERNQLRAKFSKSSETEPSIPDLITIEPATGIGAKISNRDLTKYTKELATLKAELASLLFINPKEKKEAREMIGDLENHILSGSVSDQLWNQEKQEIQSFLERLKNNNQRGEELWYKAQDVYFSLHNQIFTAKLDPHLRVLLKEEIDDGAKILEDVVKVLSGPQEDDIKSCLETLREFKTRFTRKVDNALSKHQKQLNKVVEDIIVNTMEDLGYGEFLREENDEGISIAARNLTKHRDAMVQFRISNEGKLEVDLSRKGFKNQMECSEELLNIREALRKNGVYIELTKIEHTWLPQMVKYLVDQLASMGYSKDSISIEKTQGGQRIIAVDSSGKSTEITVDASTGNIESEKSIVSSDEERSIREEDSEYDYQMQTEVEEIKS